MLEKLCILCVLGSAAAPGQAPDHTARRMAFEVVSIRQNVAGGKVSSFGATPDGFRMVNTPISRVISEAYPPQTGGALWWEPEGYPDWANADRYDIVARIPDSEQDEWQKPTTQAVMLRAMLQTMLAERCKLTVHRQLKDAPVLYLEVGKGGPKFQESPPDEPPRPHRFPGGGAIVPEGSTMHFYQAPMPLLASMLTNRNLGGPEIQDRTGLTGRYDFVVDWGAWTGGMSAADDAGDPGPTLFSAVGKLGLKLVPAKGQVEKLVVDHIERPSDN